MSYSVTQRRQEIGARMALRAARGDIFRLVVGQAMTLVLAGLGVGLAGALAITRFLQTLLFALKPSDPATLAAVALRQE